MTWGVANGPTGPAGPAGVAAYTTLAASFTQPASGDLVTAQLVVGSWVSVGQYIFIAGGGAYQVTTAVGPNSYAVINLGSAGNAAPGATVPLGASVSPGGKPGPIGPQGATGATGATGASGGTLLVDVAQLAFVQYGTQNSPGDYTVGFETLTTREGISATGFSTVWHGDDGPVVGYLWRSLTSTLIATSAPVTNTLPSGTYGLLQGAFSPAVALAVGEKYVWAVGDANTPHTNIVLTAYGYDVRGLPLWANSSTGGVTVPISTGLTQNSANGRNGTCLLGTGSAFPNVDDSRFFLAMITPLVIATTLP